MIKRGDIILTEKPLVLALKSKYRKERCDCCLSVSKVRKCSNCQYVSYCSRQCQGQSWPMHKIECPFLKNIYPRTVPDAARLLCKLIIKLNNGGDLERGYYTPNNYRKFRDLMSHYTEIRNDPKRIEHLQSLHAVLSEMMQGSLIVPNQTELMSIYGRLITNGFNILDPEMNSIATGIYLGVSVTDHSCNPNAVATFEGTTLHIRVTEDMERLDWSKIFISYIELLNTKEERRKDLKDNYYFLCVCSKCVDPDADIEMNGAACPNKKCDAVVNISLDSCGSCDTSITSEHRNAFNDAIMLTKTHLEKMKDVAFSTDLDICEICLNKQKGYVHALNIWHIKLLDSAFEGAINIGKWSVALEYGKQLLLGFRKYYGDWNPLLGLLYMKIGKIQLYEENLIDAKSNLKEAHKILKITHGPEHSLIREQLLPMLMQVTAKC